MKRATGLLALVVAIAGCVAAGPSSSAPAKGTAPAIYPTIEEAAVGAWEFNVNTPGLASEEWYTGPGSGLFDRAATLKLWRSKPALLEKDDVDLNGDGVVEVLLYNGRYVDMTGRETDADGGMGANRSWAVMQKVVGGWRVVGAGWGRYPLQAQKHRTNGWADLAGGYHLSASAGAGYLYQFDGMRYQRIKTIEYDYSAGGTTALDQPVRE